MRSVRRRLSEASTTFLMRSGRLFRPTVPSISKPNLRGDRDPVAEGRERFADKFLARVGAIHFGGIEERDAFFVGCPDDPDALGFCRREGRSWR